MGNLCTLEATEDKIKLSTADGSWHCSAGLGKVHSLQLFPWEEKRRVEHASNILASLGAARGTGFCLLLLYADRDLAYFGCLKATSNKIKLSGLLQHQRICETPEETRLKFLEETGKTLYLANYMHESGKGLRDL